MAVGLQRQQSPPPTASASTAESRIAWQGGQWYLHGANVPWFNWGCDFGCGTSRGVSDPAVQVELEAAFRTAQESGIRVLRWWMFPGDAAHIQRRADGAPAAVAPQVYADIDAALKLAERYDLYFVFTLFSSPTHVPSGWLADEGQRGQLVQALTPLFQRYATNPRVMTWDVFNEPDWAIMNGEIAKAPVQATVQAIAVAVHANSPAYVTVAAAMLEGLANWVGLGLDYYTVNWYDPMPDRWCARCTDYQRLRAKYGLDAPLVIGEFYAGPDTDALQRFEDFYAKGYAGAWAWSIFPSHTSDKMAVDQAAAAAFAAGAPDTGPRPAIGR
ncbi:MAG: hypothetical protein U0531_10135 [Dehalococcoidia bacterium]